MITGSGNIMSERWWPGDLKDAAKESDSADQSDDHSEDDESERDDQAATTGARK